MDSITKHNQNAAIFLQCLFKQMSKSTANMRGSCFSPSAMPQNADFQNGGGGGSPLGVLNKKKSKPHKIHNIPHHLKHHQKKANKLMIKQYNACPNKSNKKTAPLRPYPRTVCASSVPISLRLFLKNLVFPEFFRISLQLSPLYFRSGLTTLLSLRF